MKQKNRVINYDIARTIAIICVVLCHSIQTAYINMNTMLLSNISQIFRIMIFTIGRLGVPIFLFLTGALILKKEIENDYDVLKFYKKNLIPLLITVEIWNILYNIFLAILYKTFDLKIFIYNILFFTYVNVPNMWYMPMILGIYLAIPFLAKIVKTFTIKTIKIPMLVVLTVTMLVPSLNVILNIFQLKNYSVILDISYLGGTYGLYIILGYYLTNNKLLKNIKSLWIWVSMVIAFVLTFFVQYISYKKNIDYDLWYNFITVLICGVCLFEIITRIKLNEKNIFIKITRYISKISLGIFFMHEIFLKIFEKHIGILKVNNPIKTGIVFFISIFASIGSIYLFSKVKFIKEKFFLIKE